VYRKTLLVMLYSHFEGVCKAAFSVYVQSLNAENAALSDVVPALAASGMAEVFRDLRNAERKSPIFRVTAPDDSGLHRYARDREFVERMGEFLKLRLLLDSELIVDTESNLTPVVLQKIMFRLGLDHQTVERWARPIGELLGRRNSVAHGTHRKGVDEKTYAELEGAVFLLVDEIIRAVFEAMVKGVHLRASAA
jgi:hypothetical protein